MAVARRPDGCGGYAERDEYSCDREADPECEESADYDAVAVVDGA